MLSDELLNDDSTNDELVVEIPSTESWGIPEVLPILPLKNTVVFPLTLTPLAVGQERSLKLVNDAYADDKLIGFIAQKDSDIQVAGPADVFVIGTVGKIQQLIKMADGTIRLVVQGIVRFIPEEYVEDIPYLKAKIRLIPDQELEPDLEVEALTKTVLSQFQRLVALSPYLPDELVAAAMNLEDPLQVAYFVANSIHLDLESRQELLELDSLHDKLKSLTIFLGKELEVLELGRKIQSQAEEQMTKAQKDYLLREQLKAIQRELGEEDAEQSETRDLERRLEEAGLPPEAKEEARRELTRLERIPSASPEHGVIRTYLEWLVSLPWSKSTGGKIDVIHAREVLDEDHYDLEKVKERIIEYLAVRKLKEERTAEGESSVMREPILCFVGPPGVGKTSLGQSIARALGRKFVRQALGGMRDEAEIRGHRRTYIGALPGRIIQAIRRAEVNNPVFILDEVDKIGADWRGDPASALLEVLDPEQNKDFRDHYLDLPFDLTNVMFITTANTLDTIPAPLRDRMEILELPGYMEEEKVRIAQKFLVPKQKESHGLRPEEISFDEEALKIIVRDYTREAGVRNLEREIASVCRKVAKEIAEGKEGVTIHPDDVRSRLGRPRHFKEVAERTDRPGVATGLVWTPVGGDIAFVEATVMPGAKVLKLTGQMGDVMKESVEAALSYIRSRASDLGIDPNFFEKTDIHVHVPAAAVPKDGPSAGITMASALVSILTGRPVRSDLAMTGEITLRGKVLPVGGIKDKVLAARRAGLKTVILPKMNEGDLDELPEDLKKELTFVLVENVDEVFAKAFVDGQLIPTTKKKNKGDVSHHVAA